MRRNKTSAQNSDDVESDVKKKKGCGHVSVQRGGAGRIPPPIALPVSSELFRSTVFSSAPYLSNSSLFQTSHREPPLPLFLLSPQIISTEHVSRLELFKEREQLAAL